MALLSLTKTMREEKEVEPRLTWPTGMRGRTSRWCSRLSLTEMSLRASEQQRPNSWDKVLRTRWEAGETVDRLIVIINQREMTES